MTRAFYDDDDVMSRPRRVGLSGWGLVAPQVFGVADYQPPTTLSGRPVCAETDPNLFFPEKDQGASYMARFARKVCAGCPIKDECLEGALERREEFGIWGGTTPRQRQVMRRKVEVAAA